MSVEIKEAYTIAAWKKVLKLRLNDLENTEEFASQKIDSKKIVSHKEEDLIDKSNSAKGGFMPRSANDPAKYLTIGGEWKTLEEMEESIWQPLETALKDIDGDNSVLFLTEEKHLKNRMSEIELKINKLNPTKDECKIRFATKEEIMAGISDDIDDKEAYLEEIVKKVKARIGIKRSA